MDEENVCGTREVWRNEVCSVEHVPGISSAWGKSTGGCDLLWIPMQKG